MKSLNNFDKINIDTDARSIFYQRVSWRIFDLKH